VEPEQTVFDRDALDRLDGCGKRRADPRRAVAIMQSANFNVGGRDEVGQAKTGPE
jgi:hypothetical protein